MKRSDTDGRAASREFPARSALEGRLLYAKRALLAGAVIGACLGLGGPNTPEAASLDPSASSASSCGSPFQPAQQDRNEQRGCCVLITESGPRCAYASRGYCEMRASEANLMYEFHEVASCSDVPQCR